MIVFLNGRFLDEQEARIAPTDRGFTLGDGVFDTLLAVDGRPVWAAAHFERLRDHAGALRISLPLTVEALAQTASELLQRNRFTAGRFAIRTTLTRGPSERGLAPPDDPAPTLLMRASPTAALDGLPPPRLIVARSVRRNAQSPLSRIKSMQYGDNQLALMEAQTLGAEDALILNAQDRLACATTGNVFIRLDGELLTPPPADGAIAGITRARVFEEYGAREASLTPDDLARCAAVYLTNSLLGMRAAALLDGRALPERGLPGAMPLG